MEFITNPKEKLFNFVEKFDKARSIPSYLEFKAHCQHKAQTACTKNLPKKSILENLDSYTTTHSIGKKIAKSLRDHELNDLADRLDSCRNSASIFQRATVNGPKLEYIWDHKCSLSKLCPHCSREKQQYFTNRYLEPLTAWKSKGRDYQLQFIVLTWPNIPAGELKDKKKLMWKCLSDFLKRDICKAVHGALATMEDPLSVHDDFNVHINLVVMVNGWFLWSEVRADWYKHTKKYFPDGDSDYQMSFNDIDRWSVQKTLAELVKYMAKHVTDKPDDKTAAPGLVDWSVERFNEWWETQQHSRRVRAFGLLHRLYGYYWQFMWNQDRRTKALAGLDLDVARKRVIDGYQKDNRLTDARRAELIGSAQAACADPADASTSYKALHKVVREALSPLLIPKPEREFTDQAGRFVGRCGFDVASQSYYYREPTPIDSILGHKSRFSDAENLDSFHDPPEF